MELLNGTENPIRGLDKNVWEYCINMFKPKAQRSLEEIKKDIINYLKKKMEKSNNENCFTYKDNTNKFFNRPGPNNWYIPEDDFNQLDAEMKSLMPRLDIFEIAEEKGLFKQVENITHDFTKKTTLTGPDYYTYHKRYNGFYKIGKYSHSKHSQGTGENINPAAQDFFKLESDLEAKPLQNAQYVYEYNPSQNENNENLTLLGTPGGKPRRTRRRKNKKRRSSRRKN
jgi:hypothetical protein